MLHQQENCGLYAAVNSNETYRNGSFRTLSDYFTAVSANIGKNDVFILQLPDFHEMDLYGEFKKWDLLENILRLNAQRGVILINPGDEIELMETALGRLQKWLGPEKIPVSIGEAAVLELMKTGDDYLGTGELARLAAGGDFPFADYPLLDRKAGRSTPAPSGNQPSWLSYSGNAALQNLISSLPSFGVFLDELNPVNYQRIDAPVMLSMGMEQYRVSFLEGNKFYNAGDYDRAISEYNKVIGLKSDFADAYAWRGNAYRRKGEFVHAIDDYTRALRYKPNYPEVYNYRGFVYSQRGDYDRAISDYTQAIRMKTDYTDAIFNRAYAYGKKTDYDRAITDYTAVLRLETGNAAAYLERGRAWQAKGNQERANSDFSAAEKYK